MKRFLLSAALIAGSLFASAQTVYDCDQEYTGNPTAFMPGAAAGGYDPLVDVIVNEGTDFTLQSVLFLTYQGEPTDVTVAVLGSDESGNPDFDNIVGFFPSAAFTVEAANANMNFVEVDLTSETITLQSASGATTFWVLIMHDAQTLLTNPASDYPGQSALFANLDTGEIGSLGEDVEIFYVLSGECSTESAPEVPCTTAVSPADGATDVAMDASISWEAIQGEDGDVITYDVYVGAAPDELQLRGTIGGTEASFTDGWSAAGFNYGDTVYWKVAPKINGVPATDCPVWSFVLVAEVPEAPHCVTLVSPADDAEIPVGTAEVTFVWNAPADGPAPTGYKLYASVNGGAEQSFPVTGTNTERVLGISGLPEGTTIDWRVAAVNGGVESVDCEEVFLLTIVATTGTNTFANDKISVYPNPAKDVVNITGAGVTNVTVTDINGRTVASSANAQVNIANLSAGVYFLNITSTEGNAVKKIVKQ